MPQLSIPPSEEDDDVSKAIMLITSQQGLYDWTGDRGPVGAKVPFTARRMVAATISEIKESTSGVYGRREVQLITQGNSAIFQVLVGDESIEEWRRCIYRVDVSLPAELSFQSMRKHVLSVKK